MKERKPTTMKRFLPIIVLSLAGAVLFADETTEVYKRIYLEAESLQQKYSAILDLARLEDRDAAPVLADALSDLIREQERYRAGTERELYARTVRIVAAALGEAKYDEAAASLWDVVEQVPDALARSEALVALGKLRALPYAERIALLLRDLDLKPTEDADAGEKVAYGAILALEKMPWLCPEADLALERLKDPRGFAPVFFAIDGWYSLRVRQQAERSLPNIAADPTDAIKGILAVETPDRMVRAMKAEAASGAAKDRKAEAALLALGIGHARSGRDKAEAQALGQLRKLALRALVANEARGPDFVPACVASYEKGVDDEERLLGLQALGVNGTDPAAQALGDVLLKLDSEQRAGLGSESRDRMAKAAIENAALARNKLARTALLLIASNDAWSGGVILAAKKAEEALK